MEQVVLEINPRTKEKIVKPLIKRQGKPVFFLFVYNLNLIQSYLKTSKQTKEGIYSLLEFFIGTGDRIRTHTRSFGRCYPDFEDRCATFTPRRCLATPMVAFLFIRRFLRLFAFVWHPTRIVAFFNRIVFLNPIFLALVKFIE